MSVALLKEAFLAAPSWTQKDAELIARVMDSLMRMAPNLTRNEVLACFGALKQDPQYRLLLSDLHLASCLERNPAQLDEMLRTNTDTASRTALLRRAIRLRWFEPMAQAMRTWTMPQILLALPIGDLDSLPMDAEEGAASFCTTLGVRHRCIYRHAAKAGDTDFLARQASEAALVERNDVNGGLARATLPWALGTIISESARAGLLDFSYTWLQRSAPAFEHQPPWRGVVEDVALHAGRHGYWDIATTLLPDVTNERIAFEIKFQLGFADAGGWREQLAQWHGIAPKEAAPLGEELCSELLRRNDVDAAYEVLSWSAAAASGLRFASEHPLAPLVRRAVEHFCAVGEYETAVRWAEVLGGEHVKSAFFSAGHAAALGGQHDIARRFASRLGGHEGLLAVVDSALPNTEPPAKGSDPSQRLTATLLRLEAMHGRSPASVGFGISPFRIYAQAFVRMPPVPARPLPEGARAHIHRPKPAKVGAGARRTAKTSPRELDAIPGMRSNLASEVSRLLRIFRDNGRKLALSPLSSEAPFDEVQATTGIVLEEDMKAFYRAFGGADGASLFAIEIAGPTWFELNPLPRAIESWDGSGPHPIAKYPDLELEPRDRRIHPDAVIHPGWFPFADSSGGSARLYYDTAPTKHGRHGQIIAFQHDPDEIFYVAASFFDFLRASNDLLEKAWDELESY
ncbi:SMI1/KNR4 family protein [Pendulispora brunnea]|uniref:SMI1/KNR4 family protein n=1 Tax=Pendulispora brunnea TaxID=2905690 RepID=A0ABZ2JW00_9BACT